MARLLLVGVEEEGGVHREVAVEIVHHRSHSLVNSLGGLGRY